jgi:hypothetical protein
MLQSSQMQVPPAWSIERCVSRSLEAASAAGRAVLRGTGWVLEALTGGPDGMDGFYGSAMSDGGPGYWQATSDYKAAIQARLGQGHY